MSGKINVAECIAHLRNDAECIASDDTGPIASNMRRAARALEGRQHTCCICQYGNHNVTLWDFTCRAERLENGYYRVTLTGNVTGERRESVGYHPLWELIRLIG